ncbi:MAG TPA: DUF2203 domain-containing protein [Blastocatellia bacterium]|jgi:hypothetical protein|nr:DUF2203 domain-containing protein [Blastocatellia bacterium]
MSRHIFLANDFQTNFLYKNAMKLFTIEEANALLPEVKRMFAKIDRARATLRRMAPEAKRASESPGGGGVPSGFQYSDALATFLASAQEILGLGVEIKDFDQGLIDFPSRRDGKIVYLCWRRGEESIEWWHDLDAGFAGRQPL